MAKSPREPIPSIYRAKFRFEGPEIARCWERFLRDRRCLSARTRIIEHYAPFVRLHASRLLAGNPDFFGRDLNVLLSDGMLALLYYLEKTDVPLAPAFRAYQIKRRVIWQIWKSATERMYGGRKSMKKAGILRRERAQLTQQLGRVPTPEEMTDAIARLIDNPEISIGQDERTRLALQLGRAPTPEETRGALRHLADNPAIYFGRINTVSLTRDDGSGQEPAAKSRDVAEPIIDRETVKLALKGLRGDDRKIVRLLLSGYGPKEIGQKMGFANERGIRRRLNGVLWELRRRADLAAHLGVEPWTGDVPLRGHSGRSQRDLCGITAVPPAKRVG